MRKGGHDDGDIRRWYSGGCHCGVSDGGDIIKMMVMKGWDG